MKRRGLWEGMKEYRSSVSIAAATAVLIMLVLGFMAVYWSFTLHNAPVNSTDSWRSQLLLNLGTSFFSAVPTFILFELIVNRYRRQETMKNTRDRNLRESLIRELVDSSTQKQRKQEIINRLKADKLLNGFEVDLSGADLSELDFSDADLSSADLRGAILRGIKARRTLFQGTQLSSSNLSGADLSGSTFQRASMRRTDLRKAKLIGADFAGAFIGEMKLQGADLSGASLKGAILRDNGVDEPHCDIETILPDHREWSSDVNSLIRYTR